MPNLLHKVVIQWTGAQIKGLAVSVLHFDASSAPAPDVVALQSALSQLAGNLPLGVSLTVPTTGDTIDSGSGALVSAWSAATTSAVQGSGPANAAAGVGACFTLDTAAVLRGRRLRGRFFAVPLHASMYDNDGTFTGSGYTSLKNAATALAGVPGLMVWGRAPATLPGTGSAAAVTGARVSDRVAVLRSRRY